MYTFRRMAESEGLSFPVLGFASGRYSVFSTPPSRLCRAAPIHGGFGVFDKLQVPLLKSSGTLLFRSSGACPYSAAARGNGTDAPCSRAALLSPGKAADGEGYRRAALPFAAAMHRRPEKFSPVRFNTVENSVENVKNLLKRVYVCI